MLHFLCSLHATCDANFLRTTLLGVRKVFSFPVDVVWTSGRDAISSRRIEVNRSKNLETRDVHTTQRQGIVASCSWLTVSLPNGFFRVPSTAQSNQSSLNSTNNGQGPFAPPTRIHACNSFRPAAFLFLLFLFYPCEPVKPCLLVLTSLGYPCMMIHRFAAGHVKGLQIDEKKSSSRGEKVRAA